jgi:hypothetical protein
LAPRIQIGTVLRVKVEFTRGTPPPRLARIALSRNAVHRVINPRRDDVATFHDVPEGLTDVTASLEGRLVARKQVVVPPSGELDVTLRIGGKTLDDHPYHGGFKVVDDDSGEPFPGRKYRITSATGVVMAEGETDENGETEQVGTDEPMELHLELLDDDDDDDDDDDGDGDEIDGDDDGDAEDGDGEDDGDDNAVERR